MLRFYCLYFIMITFWTYTHADTSQIKIRALTGLFFQRKTSLQPWHQFKCNRPQSLWRMSEEGLNAPLINLKSPSQIKSISWLIVQFSDYSDKIRVQAPCNIMRCLRIPNCLDFNNLCIFITFIFLSVWKLKNVPFILCHFSFKYFF